jgi:hypothetical protein
MTQNEFLQSLDEEKRGQYVAVEQQAYEQLIKKSAILDIIRNIIGAADTTYGLRTYETDIILSVLEIKKEEKE